jgi:hypothetical protein
MLNVTPKTLRPDTKGRVTLGKLAEGISSFQVSVDQQNRIILMPFVEIPARESWLFQNKKALEKVQRGIKDAERLDLVDRGSFVQYLDEAADE